MHFASPRLRTSGWFFLSSELFRVDLATVFRAASYRRKGTALKTVGRLCQTPTILAQTRQSISGSADPWAIEFRKLLNESREPRIEVSCTHEVVHLAHVRFEFIQELKKIFFGVNLFGLPTEVS